MEPRTICVRNFTGIAMRPFASIVCSYSPRNIVTAVYSRTTSSFDGPFVEGMSDVLPHPVYLSLPFPPPTVRTLEIPTFPHFSPPHYTIFCKLAKGSYPPIFANKVDNLWITFYVRNSRSA